MVTGYLGCWYRSAPRYLGSTYRERLEVHLGIQQVPEDSVAVGIDGTAARHHTAGVSHADDGGDSSSAVRDGDEHGPVASESAEQRPVLLGVRAGANELEVKTDQPWGWRCAENRASARNMSAG